MTDPRYVVEEEIGYETSMPTWIICFEMHGGKAKIDNRTFYSKAAAKDFCWILNQARQDRLERGNDEKK